MNQLILQQVGERIVWTLAHSLWQFAAIAIVLAVVLQTTRGSSSQARYRCSFVAMIALAIVPVVTFCLFSPTEPIVAADQVGSEPEARNESGNVLDADMPFPPSDRSVDEPVRSTDSAWGNLHGRINDDDFRVWHERTGALRNFNIGNNKTDNRGRIVVNIQPSDNELADAALCDMRWWLRGLTPVVRRKMVGSGFGRGTSKLGATKVKPIRAQEFRDQGVGSHTSLDRHVPNRGQNLPVFAM